MLRNAPTCPLRSCRQQARSYRSAVAYYERLKAEKRALDALLRRVPVCMYCGATDCAHVSSPEWAGTKLAINI